MSLFAIRHGETEWSLSGKHTGTTDIPFTDNGRRLADRLRPVLAREKVRAGSHQSAAAGARDLRLAGLGASAVIDPDLVEWNYGAYEGLTPKQIHEAAPDWLIFRERCRSMATRSMRNVLPGSPHPIRS